MQRQRPAFDGAATGACCPLPGMARQHIWCETGRWGIYPKQDTSECHWMLWTAGGIRRTAKIISATRPGIEWLSKHRLILLLELLFLHSFIGQTWPLSKAAFPVANWRIRCLQSLATRCPKPSNVRNALNCCQVVTCIHQMSKYIKAWYQTLPLSICLSAYLSIYLSIYLYLFFSFNVNK